MITCKNCLSDFEGNYCPNCAQSAHVHRFTIAHILHELFHATIHLDKGVFFLVRELLYKPGHVAAAYVSGKRKTYFNPFTFILLMIALMVFSSNATNIFEAYQKKTEQQAVSLIRQLDIVKKKNAAIIKKLREDLKNGSRQTKKAFENSRLINLIFIPVQTLLTWLFFRKKKYNYAENLLLNVFVNSGNVLLFCLFCILPFLIFPSYVILIMTAYMFLTISYAVMAYRQFFKESWLASILKGVAVQVIYITCTQLGLKYLISYL